MESARGRAHARKRLVEKDPHDVFGVRRAHQHRRQLVERAKARATAVTNTRHSRAGKDFCQCRRPVCSSAFCPSATLFRRVALHKASSVVPMDGSTGVVTAVSRSATHTFTKASQA